MERRSSRNFLNARYWLCIGLFNGLVLLGFGLVLCKAFQLQVIEYSVWQERGRAQGETTLRVPTYRGSIYDRAGRLLSYSVPQRSLVADGDMVENPKKLAAQLTPILGESTSFLEKRLSCSRRFVWIKRHLTDQQASQVEALKARGLSLVNEYKRFYPYRQVAGQVVGFVDMDGEGLEGVEKSYDDLLKHSSKNVEQLRDGVRKCLWLQPCLPPEPGESYGLRLSLDTFIQYLAECELEKTVAQYKARSGEIVVIDTQSFEILAMANWPFFDPNLIEKRNADLYRNRSITDSFEPGSTFKVFLVCAALEENVVRERDRVFCENGKCTLAGHTINDTHPHGWLSIPEVIKYSSNIGASKVALQLGGERYFRYIKAFGFGNLSGIDLPGEVKGLVRHCKKWRPIDLATTGFGQSIGVTALQLTQAVACIANGGEYTQPMVGREVLSSQEQVVRQLEKPPYRQAIQKRTAQQICDMMKLVTIEGGTGVNAAPEGYTVAGKTGTAQVLDPQTRRYAANKYTSVFTGFVPADRPRLAISVVIHEPHGAIYGGIVAAPAFKNIAAKALPYLGIPPASGEGLKPAPLPKGLKTASGEGSKPASAPATAKQKTAVHPVATEKSAEKGKACAVAQQGIKSGEKDKGPARMPDTPGMGLKKVVQPLTPQGGQVKAQTSSKVVERQPIGGAPSPSKTQVELVLSEARERP